MLLPSLPLLAYDLLQLLLAGNIRKGKFVCHGRVLIQKVIVMQSIFVHNNMRSNVRVINRQHSRITKPLSSIPVAASRSSYQPISLLEPFAPQLFYQNYLNVMLTILLLIDSSLHILQRQLRAILIQQNVVFKQRALLV